MKIGLSDVEAPSNHVLVELLYGGRLRVDVSYANVARPDPRAPIADVAHALWRREGETLVPALAPPPRAIAERIATLAIEPFARERAWAAASRVAAALTRADVPQVLACAVRPPAPRPGSTPLGWLPRVQLAAAFVVAQVALDEPWETSARRDALRSLLLGPMDWSTTAAIVALARLTQDEPAIVLDVHRELVRLIDARPSSGAVCWEQTLFDEWLGIDGLYPPEREELIRRSDALRNS